MYSFDIQYKNAKGTIIDLNLSLMAPNPEAAENKITRGWTSICPNTELIRVKARQEVIMAKAKLTTKVRKYVDDVLELRKMRGLSSTRIGDIDDKYNSLVKRGDVIQNLMINRRLDGKVNSRTFSPFITTGPVNEDYGERALQYVEEILDDGEAKDLLDV